MATRIIEATTAAEMEVAAALFREYAESLPFSLCFQGFEQEVATLPGRYAHPRGRIILAYEDSTSGGPALAVGCIALREIGSGICEMKRMYVQPAYRGKGIGRALAQRLIDAAHTIGYQEMRLDSEDNMTAAIGLYRSLGFTHTERYNDDPHPHTVWMKLNLAGARETSVPGSRRDR